MALSGYPVGGFPPNSTSTIVGSMGSQPGVCSDAFPRVRSLANSARVADVWTFTIDTFVGETDYTISLEGVNVTVTSPVTSGNATTDKNAVRNLFVAAINDSEFIFNGALEAATNGNAVFTVTGKQEGRALSVEEVDANLSVVNTTPAANNSSIPFGAVVCNNSDGLGFALPSPVAAVAAVKTATPVNVNAAVYFASVRDVATGVIYGPAEYTADGSATVKEVVEGLQPVLSALVPVGVAAITEDDAKLIATAGTAGNDIEWIVGSSSASATWTRATTTDNVEAGLTASIAGVVQHASNRPGGVVLPDDSATIVEQCQTIFLQPENAPASLSSAIYLRHTAGAASNQTRGRIRFTDDDSGKCILLDSSTIRLVRLAAEKGYGTYAFAIPRPLAVA